MIKENIILNTLELNNDYTILVDLEQKYVQLCNNIYDLVMIST